MRQLTSHKGGWVPPSEWLEKIVRLNTVTDRSNLSVVTFLRPLLEQAGLTVRLHEVKERGIRFFNIVAHNNSLANRNLLALHTHLDTVEPGPLDLWTKCGGNPFALTQSGRRLYGLGAADVKIDFLCKLWAIKQAGENLPPLALVGSYGEERGLVGARRLLETRWYRPRYAMVGEPSLLEIIFAHKGHLVVRVSLKRKSTLAKNKTNYLGKAAHSSTPHLGDNAIEKALLSLFNKDAAIVTLDGGVGSNTIPSRCTAEWNEGPSVASVSLQHFMVGIAELRRDLAKQKDSRFAPSTPTVSVNWVRSLPNEIQFVFDVRLLPATNVEKVKKKITSILKNSAMKLLSLDHDPGLDGSKEDALVRRASQALSAIGVKPVIQTKASCTEAALYFEKGAQAFVFGPGRSIGNVHKPNEFNELPQIQKATRFYTEMIQSFARKA